MLRTRTEILALEGDRHLERVRWRDHRTGAVETHVVRHVFMMTGAVPNTGWLHGWVVLDSKGFVKMGTDLSHDDLAAAGWPLARPPYLLETSRPGVFAVGDVTRRDKRVVRGAAVREPSARGAAAVAPVLALAGLTSSAR